MPHPKEKFKIEIYTKLMQISSKAERKNEIEKSAFILNSLQTLLFDEVWIDGFYEGKKEGQKELLKEQEEQKSKLN